MRLVVIGCGGMGTYHIKKFKSLGAKIIGAVDLNLEKLKKLQLKYDIGFIETTIKELDSHIGEFDAISVAVVDSLHISVLNRIAKFNVPIFMEKPLSFNYEQIKEITIDNNYPLMINFSKHNYKGILTLKHYIDSSNSLGKLEKVKISYLQNWTITKCWGDYVTDSRWNWRLNPDISCLGCLGDLGSHAIDVLLYLFPKLEYVSLINYKLFEGNLFKPKQSNPIFSTCNINFISEDTKIEMLVSNESDSEDDFVIELKYREGEIIFNNTTNRNVINIITNNENYEVENQNSFSTYKAFIDLVDNNISNFLNLNFAIKVQDLLNKVAQDVANRDVGLLK